MIADLTSNRRILKGNVVLLTLIILVIRLFISCGETQKETKDQVSCEVLYLKSAVSSDSLNPGYINNNFENLSWGELTEKDYSKLNRKNELWYRIMIPEIIPEKSVLVMAAYTQEFDVFSGDQMVYHTPQDGRFTFFRIHVIPVMNSVEPVFIRFRYDNFNNAIIRYPIYAVPEKHITEDLSTNKYNPFNLDLMLVFPGTALCMLGVVAILLYFRRRYKEYNTFLYFGLFSLLTGILYILPVARLPRINLSPDWYWAIEHFILHVLLIFFVLLNMSIFNAGKTRLFKVLMILLAILALLDFPVFLFYPLPFHANVVLGLIVFTFIISSVIIGYRNTHDSKGIKRFMYYMLLLTYLLAVVDVVMNFFLPPNDIVLFGIGILVYELAVVYYLEDQYYINLGRSQQFFTELEFRKNEILRLEQENLRSQFSALKSQINPHFLFNSLNVLTSIIRRNPDLSEKYVEQLSKIYRYILEFKSEELVSFQTELEFIGAYLFLMNIRFGEKLTIEIDKSLYLINARIPHLSLQMLIENAVKHNSFSTRSPLKIQVYRVDNMVVVSNNLQPRTIKEASTGLGLKNIEERYRLVSGGIPSFGIVQNVFVAKLPLIE